MITETARAKVNLTLQVKARRADGYHLLESLVVFPDVGDELTFEPSRDLGLVVTGSHKSELDALDPKDNLVARAAEFLKKEFEVRQGACITLKKELPIASGIGGGSADAAAAIRGLIRLWSLPAEEKRLQEIALGLGADVPVCLESGSAIMSGVGEIIEPVLTLPPFWLVLVNCDRKVSTSAVFQSLDLPEPNKAPNLTPGKFSSFSSLIELLVAGGNDLQEAAITLEPDIQVCLDVLSACDGIALARMSGSGATCFGIFENEGDARRAAETLTSRHPDWWVRAAKVD